MHIATAEWAKKPLQTVEAKDIIAWLQKLQKTKAVRNSKTLSRTLSFQSRKHLRNLVSAMFADAVGIEPLQDEPRHGHQGEENLR